MTERLLTVERVAELTGLSRRSVYREVDAGGLDAYRLRGRVRIPEAALESWLEARRVSPRKRERLTAEVRAGAAAPSDLRRILLSEPSANRREGR
jgi:excisionase family DNA binding protein